MAGSLFLGFPVYVMAVACPSPEAPGLTCTVDAPPQVFPLEDSKPSFRRIFSSPLGKYNSHRVVGAGVGIAVALVVGIGAGVGIAMGLVVGLAVVGT